MTARLYVGTYAKYNSGSIRGAWLDLEDYSDKDAFLEACRKLHADEEDPEYMFQDYEGFPSSLYSESSVSDALFEFAALDDDDQELLSVYLEHIDSDGDIERAREAFHGKHNTRADFAESWLRDTCGLEGVPEHLENYIDFDAYARDMDHDGWSFIRHDGDLWVFSND